MTKKILLCEDEATTQQLVCAALEGLGHTMHTTSHGAECLSVLRQDVSQIDLLILDLNMPVLNGIEVLKIINAENFLGNFPILVLSAHKDLRSIEQAIKLGAGDYLVKPVNIRQLIQRVSELMFEVGEQDVQNILSGIRFPDPLLFQAPSLRPWMNAGFSAFQNNVRGTSECVLTPEGETAKNFENMPLKEIEKKVLIFRKGETGWKKIWPQKAYVAFNKVIG